MAEDVSLPIEVACKRRKLENDNPATNIDQGESFVHNELNGNFAVENGQEPQIYNPMRNDTEDESDNNGNDEIDDSASDISSISGFSEEEWQSAACSESLMMIQEKMMAGVNPRTILDELLPTKVQIPDDLDHFTMWKIIINIMSEPPRRKKLPNINTLGQVLELLNNSNKIMVLTGAGVSVSCGIPDFRSKDGIYARLAVDFPDLPDPQAMFDIRYFSKDPRPFFKFAKEIYPGQFEPSRSHKFIRLLEKQSKLLRNYTQNIDTLEQVAGISNVIQCHGSFATASCTKCKHKVDADAIKDDIFNQVIPKCPVCNPDVAEAEFGIMKPDIVFFGESLPEAFHKQMAADKDKCDLLIVIGSSLKVRPVALIPNSVPADVPQILINREPLSHMTFDIELLGDCDTIISELCVRLGWEGICDTSQKPMEQVGRDQLKTPMNGEETAGTSGLRIDADLPSSLSAANVHEEREPNIDHVNKRNKTMTSQLKVSDKQEKTCDNNISDSQCPAAISTITDGSALPTLNGNSDTDVFTDFVLDSDKSFEVDEDLEKIQTMGNPSEIDDELEEMRKMWEQRRESLAKLLEEKQFLFLPPCRYVFPGAEVYDEEDNHNDSDSSSSMSELSEDIQGKAETDPSQEMQNGRAIKKVAENEIGNEETEICDKVLMEKVSEKLNNHNVLIVPNSEEAASEQKAVSLETAFNSPEIASREISSSCDLQMQTGNTH